ncbi:carbohydrate-binding protein [Streptomyces sp. NBC_00160]|uniref:CBM35 domain-containing protein n=1 Tax=Streptomyces TaxID=1883 RepID=UPI0020793C20|nr:MULTISPECIES: CBM35 domain-containing protein [Streptomyces]MCM9080300.1 carbohydrate-binding protein [Streptomyces spororaveus]MCX5305291.1 carbohydrate-binding protein [Streptomyces sp. NBC_00160]
MTTPANNGPHGGANKPEDDDPFGYLYEDGQAAGATPPGQGGYGYPGSAGGGQPGPQPGVPRTSHHQVRTVGDRRNGGQRGPVPQQQGPGYQAQYQAPEALQAGGYGVPAQQAQSPQHQTQAVAHPGGHGGGRGGGGSSRRGLLIAAVAVVAVVVIGIAAALQFGDKDKGKEGPTTNAGQQSPAPQNPASPAPSSPKPSQDPLPKGEAAGAGMSITGGAALESTVPGAKSSGGQYVGGFNRPGAAVTWTLEVPKAGKYRFYVRFGIPGEDANGTLTVNGKPNEAPISMRNFAKSPKGDWEKGWQTTWGQVNLEKGTNTIKLSCETGNSCNVNIDQLWLENF